MRERPKSNQKAAKKKSVGYFGMKIFKAKNTIFLTNSKMKFKNGKIVEKKKKIMQYKDRTIVLVVFEC